jgi:glycosyltransferase involved in cell wall biosynthesis
VISVIIPHGNSLSSLNALLLSLANQRCTEAFEVLVVANPAAKYRDFPQVKVNFSVRWESSAPGANAARQKGVSMASGDVLVFLDDDCVVSDPLFLQEHFDRHIDTHISGVGGPYRLVGRQTCWGRGYHHIQNEWLHDHRLPQGLNMHLLGGNSSFKKHVFEKLRFDENILFGGTETEFQTRLYHAGHRLKLFADLKVDHDGHLRFLDFIKKAFKQGLGTSYIKAKNPPSPQFIFWQDNKRSESWHVRVAIWLYRRAFAAGQKYFEKNQVLSVDPAAIYKATAREVRARLLAKDFPLWREIRNLSHLIARRLIP